MPNKSGNTRDSHERLRLEQVSGAKCYSAKFASLRSTIITPYMAIDYFSAISFDCAKDGVCALYGKNLFINELKLSACPTFK